MSSATSTEQPSIVHRMFHFLPEGIVDALIFLFSHWLVNTAGKWQINSDKVKATIRQLAPHLKKNYLDEVRWNWLLDLMSLPQQISIINWLSTLGKNQFADVVLSLYEIVCDDNPAEESRKRDQLAKTLKDFARLPTDQEKTDFAVGRFWMQRDEKQYPAANIEKVNAWLRANTTAYREETERLRQDSIVKREEKQTRQIKRRLKRAVTSITETFNNRGEI